MEYWIKCARSKLATNESFQIILRRGKFSVRLSRVSCVRKQREPLMGLELTTARHPPIMSQTHYWISLVDTTKNGQCKLYVCRYKHSHEIDLLYDDLTRTHQYAQHRHQVWGHYTQAMSNYQSGMRCVLKVIVVVGFDLRTSVCTGVISWACITLFFKFKYRRHCHQSTQLHCYDKRTGGLTCVKQ